MDLNDILGSKRPRKEIRRVPVKKEWKEMREQLKKETAELYKQSQIIEHKSKRMWLLIEEEAKHFGSLEFSEDSDELILFED